MESPKTEHGGIPGMKVLETLRRNLFDMQDSLSGPSKVMSSREVCGTLTELTETVTRTAQKPNSSHVLSSSVELLVHSCSSPDRDVRLAASENLRKLMKSLMNTHLARLQQDLFHELKKNGSARSLCVAVDCFASLYPLTRPSKCQYFAQNLLPVLVRLTGRSEEAVHEALQDGLAKILPTMAPFLTSANIQFLMMGILQRLPKAGASYRRMASSTLHALVSNSRYPQTQSEWLISKCLDMGCSASASMELIQGVLLTLQQLFTNIPTTDPPLTMLKQAYAFIVSCLVYRDPNTTIAAMETMQQLLVSATAELSIWLTSPLITTQAATDFWSEPSDAASDTTSLVSEGLETPCDIYFDSEQEVTLSFASSGRATTGLSKVIASPTGEEPDQSDSTPSPVPVSISESGCLAASDGPQVPLANLVKHLVDAVLSNSRVSAQSLALGCIAASVDILPSVLPSLDQVLPFVSASDPKLRSRAFKLLSVIVSANLRANYLDLACCPPITVRACDQMCVMLGDDTPIVLKAACEALQECLPMIVMSSEPQRALDILRRLLPFRHSSYWLTKVELLQTLSVLDFTSLVVMETGLAHEVMTEVVFSLLGDTDHRVRTAVSEALVSLVPRVSLEGDPVLCHSHWEAGKAYSHLHTTTAMQLSLASLGGTSWKPTPPTPMCLDHILWFLLGKISSSVDHTLQRGCLEALHALSLHYPPPIIPTPWGCDRSPQSLLVIVQSLLTSSRLAWGIQSHRELLELCGSLFLSAALSHMQSRAESGQPWLALSESSLGHHASAILTHTARLLAVFVHVIENREAEPRDAKRLLVPGVSRRASEPVTSPFKGKGAQQLLEQLQRPPLVPKDGLGQFANIPHYQRILDACKAAFTNYQVSLSPCGEDKFSQLLQVVHTTLAAILEVSRADDIGKHVEELLIYLSITVRVDASGSLLCVQQLLNSLFGMNVAAQHTHLHSPFSFTLPYDISTVISPVFASSVYTVTVSVPLSLLSSWLHAPPPSALLSPSKPSPPPERKRRGLIPERRTLVVKPINSVSSLKDYLGFFEPLVIHALKQFPYTSSSVIQQRVLFLLVQLLQLKVRYELLDCNHTFLDAVLKMVGLMETGMVRGGETLVPHLFQFLVLLAYDQSKLVTVPQVIQRCDGVLASGHNVTTFAVPALQPLVLYLFIRPSRITTDLETQREVVLNMLLRLVDHRRVTVLLTCVVDCYSRDTQLWEQVSSQIYAALLPHLGKLQVDLDSREELVSLYHLLTAMDPSTINMEALFMALLKHRSLHSITQLIRWLGTLCTALELMVTIFPEKTLFKQISSLHFTVPELQCPVATVEGAVCEGDPPSQLVSFLRGCLHLAASSLDQLIVQRTHSSFSLLPTLTLNCLLLLQTLVEGPYNSLCSVFSSLPTHPSLSTSFLHLSHTHPLLTLHYLRFSLLLGGTDTTWLSPVLAPPLSSPHSSNWHLLHHASFLLLAHHPSHTLTPSPALLQHLHTTSMQKWFRMVGGDDALQGLLEQLLTGCNLEQPAHCLHALHLCRSVSTPSTLHFLTRHLLTHPLSSIASAAGQVAMEIVEALGTRLSSAEASQLLVEVEGVRGEGGRSEGWSQLHRRLCELASHSPQDQVPTVQGEEQRHGDTIHPLTQEWYVESVRAMCSRRGAEPEQCARVLGGTMVGEGVADIVHSGTFHPALLECCLVRGLQLSVVREEAESDLGFTMPAQLQPRTHPLLQACINRLLTALRRNPYDCSLTRPLLWFLVIRTQLTNEFLVNTELAVAMATLAVHSLKQSCEGDMDSLWVQSALDCCSMALQLPEVQAVVGEEMVCDVVDCLGQVVDTNYPGRHVWPEHDNKGEGRLPRAQHLLASILVTILPSTAHASPPTLHKSIETFTCTLCRHHSLHSQVLTPPILSKEGGKISEKILDQALMEAEVLEQYMQRCNPIGWLSRPEFEERWMQLLGVVNQPPPPALDGEEEGGPPSEELHAHMLNVCAGVKAATSLLLCISLRPTPGDPTSSVPMHTHRNTDVLFLGSRPGRKLAHLRRLLEMQLLLQTGFRGNLPAHYQCPTLHHVSSSHYPPLFTQNVERGLGEVGLGVGQMSLNSLWPIMLLSATTRSPANESSYVDIRSCILSLIDLYTHWLTKPIHTLLLQHMVRSVLLLSDLFVLSSQFEWMLGSLLHLYDTHPHEDVSTLALIVLGCVKAAAVLKTAGAEAERVVKVVEKSLASDSSIAVQSACVRGLLYACEDPNSSIVPLVASTLTKYITSQLTDFTRHTESHLLVLWSLAVSLANQHTHHIKDPEFSGRLLESVVPILHHPHTPSHTFHSLTLGLEHLVLTFSITAHERVSLAHTAASRFTKCDQHKSLAALSLLITCMYTGEEADALSGLTTDIEGSAAMETAAHAREYISTMMERLRHGPEVDVKFLVDVVPQLIVDFLLPLEALQTVVSELVSPHQTRPHFAACVVAETFSHLMARGQEAMITDWVLLSMESFVQQEPEAKAVWSMTCLLTAASTSPVLRAMVQIVAYRHPTTDPEAVSLLCTVGQSFYLQQCVVQSQRDQFIERLEAARYPTVKQVVQFCTN